MTVKEAIVIFAKQFPDKAVVGYWDKPNGIVLNTQSITAGLTALPSISSQTMDRFMGPTHEKQPQSWRHEETVIPWTMPQTLNRVCGFLCPKFNTQSNDIISSSADWR